MDHTKESIRRNRGLVMIIIALFAAWMLEPGLRGVATICGDLLRNTFGQ